MLQESDFVKIVVSTPVDSAEKVRQAIGDAGAGVQGNYSHCSGSYNVIGRFTPLPGANPAVGAIGTPEEVEEVVLETLCHKDKVKEVIDVIKKVHPYEEPPIDIIPRLEVS